MWNLSVQESINVTVTAQQSCISKKTQQLTLSVTVTNMNKIHHPIVTEISVLNAALLADNWTLLKEIVVPESVKLNSQESVHILLKAQRKSKKKDSYSLVSFVPQKQSIQYSNSAYLDFAKRNEQSRLNIFDTSDNIDDAKNNKKSDATFILRWQAHVIDSKGGKRTAYGQNQVPVYIIQSIEEDDEDDYVGPVVIFDTKQEQDTNTVNSKDAEDLVFLERQISYNLIHPVKIFHDFSSKKLCIIHVKMLLHSIGDTNLEVTVKTLEALR